jgi:peptidoglycan hydrolase-like protein with peptidoglycan-binding domain
VQLPYQQSGLFMNQTTPNDPALVKALQRDLRALGYLLRGIDGNFGRRTELAIRSLQYDLCNNTGVSTGGDGRAPVAVRSYNGNTATGGAPAVTSVTGRLDYATSECMAAMLADDAFTKLPSSQNPAADNAKAMAAISAVNSTLAPTPFIAAIVVQESDSAHFLVPAHGDEDNFVSIGLDRNNKSAPDQITSRGYGIGQYTIFHHPPRPEELHDFILDPVRNVQKAYVELRGKLDNFVVGNSGAADRAAEHPSLPLRLCRYANSDQRYMRNCKACAEQVGKLDITRGMPAYDGASISYQPTQYYPAADYHGVPDRAAFLCDWPYAMRRYNGDGVNSFHYQARVLLDLLSGPTQAWS